MTSKLTKALISWKRVLFVILQVLRNSQARFIFINFKYCMRLMFRDVMIALCW